MTQPNHTDMSLPDYIDHGLNILSVGLNPSIPSAKLGYYFANPRNRFWSAFKQAELIDTDIVIDDQVHSKLLTQYKIGFTDVVKRASRMGNQLRATDYKRDAPLLREKLDCYQPRIVWMHGKIAMSKFMQYGYDIKHEWCWGLNQVDQINAQVYVTPNPSPANAAYSLEDLIRWYRPIRNI